MSEIVSINFGKQEREAQARFARLIGLVDKRDADFIKDPTKFFDQAGEEISKRDLVIRNAQDALRPRIDPNPDHGFMPIRTVTVMADEYARLKACAAIIDAALE
jgi:hypothetical protein